MRQKQEYKHIQNNLMKLQKFHMPLLKFYQEKFQKKDKDIKYFIKDI